MKRKKATYTLLPGQYKELKKRMLNWGRPFSILLFLDSNDYRNKYSRYECLLAVGNSTDNCTSLENVWQHHNTNRDWLFGHICYDYKNELEPKLTSAREAYFGFPLMHFFCPDTVCYISENKLAFTIESLVSEPDDIYALIQQEGAEVVGDIPKLSFTQKIGQAKYLDTISALRRHIADGDCYEINFCNKGYAENAYVAPLAVFNALNTLSPAPFAAYYRHQDNYMMCASPERYLHKHGETITSQPIKGTARRGQNEAEDAQQKDVLKNSLKDQAENVMIVDLTRNDLARCCELGTVTVDELFGIYTFPQVHQMISTVSGKLKANVPFTDALRYSFPMGSMTGAPKVKVMQLIEQYEQARRELFSGTVGYITPEGDFDFNVVIRSLFYNSSVRYLAYQTGGAITYDSDPQAEWDEMRLKAWALERIFS
ncbi:MAG: anthranilate synthase component I family protein [Sphingobacteriales bacterium]|nr:MAG: anthranilate synthase component I family protein [Sphingobacteriales bacterium]